MRRILWCLIVAVAVGLFVGQVGRRITVYFQYKTNVDVKVKYVERIDFPSITICNQNNYRTTATVKWRLYDLIDGVFSTKNISEMDLSGYNMDVDTIQFILSTAHQKDDLIYRSPAYASAYTEQLEGKHLVYASEYAEHVFHTRCTWHGNPCNIRDNFTTIITNLGVCFTFNGGSTAISITRSGSSTGLSLILNVEQYEYMRGPQNDAGIKILLHYQGEFPQMKDQGFAVAPGTHTLVGVKRYEKKFHNAMEKSQKAVKEIAVKDETQMSTLLDSMGHLVEKLNNSYHVMQNFSILAETHKVPNILTDDILEVDAEKLRSMVKTIYDLTQFNTQPNFNYLYGYYINFLEEAMAFDKKGETAKMLDFFLFCNGTIPSMTLSAAGDAVNDQNTTDSFTTWSNRPLKSIPNPEETTKQMNSSDKDAIARESSNANRDRSTFSWLNINDRQDCPAAFNDLKQYLNNWQELHLDLKKVKEWWAIEKEYATYKENIAAIFANSTVNVKQIENHNKCLSFEEEYTTLDRIVISMTEITVEIYDANSYDEAYNSAKLLPPLYRQRLEYNASKFQEMYDYINEVCWWINYDGYDIWEKTEQAMAELTKAKDERNVARRYITVIQDYFSILYKSIFEDINPVVYLAQDYLKDIITKIDLADEFENRTFTKNIETVAGINKELLDIARDYTSAMIKGREKLLCFYKILLDLKLPILNSDNVQELELITKAKDLNDPLLQGLFNSLEDNLRGNILYLVEETYKRLTAPIESMKTVFGDPIDNVLIKIENLSKVLKDYKASTIMNTEFFMNNFVQVDIFYQELSFEEIEQNISFEFLSLLSEIGGFLGLLLGASVLTVFELLDYISLRCVGKVQRPQVQESKQENSAEKRVCDDCSTKVYFKSWR